MTDNAKLIEKARAQTGYNLHSELADALESTELSLSAWRDSARVNKARADEYEVRLAAAAAALDAATRLIEEYVPVTVAADWISDDR